jgi:DNA-binding response OmpR family regulator
VRILLIEDEIHLSEAIVHLLKQQHFLVDANYDGLEGYYNILSNRYDVVILDVMLPSMNGFDILKKVREEENTTPIIMLTARGELEDKLEGLNNGADDYLAKPFQVEELIARINAISRRKDKIVQQNIISFYDICYNKKDLTIYNKENNSKKVTLTHLENELLSYLLTREQHYTSKEQIIIKLWGYDSDAIDNNVEVYISFLRKKLKHISQKVIIKTTRNVGYRLEEQDV